MNQKCPSDLCGLVRKETNILKVSLLSLTYTEKASFFVHVMTTPHVQQESYVFPETLGFFATLKYAQRHLQIFTNNFSLCFISPVLSMHF